MWDLPKINTLQDLERLPGKPVAYADYARMEGKNRNTIYQKLERGKLPGVWFCGRLCVLVNGQGDARQADSPQSRKPRK